MPPDGALMVSAVDIFKTATARGDCRQSSTGWRCRPRPAPSRLRRRQRFVDVEGTFPAEGPAQHWETEWPTLQHKLSTNPLVMLGGFSPLLSHATLTRDGPSVRVHLSATHEETLRLLALALHMIGG